jgi:acetoin utilization deacetylase AcuC-like enzyme
VLDYKIVPVAPSSVSNPASGRPVMVTGLLFQCSDLDVPLPDGMGDADYLATVSEHLPRVLTKFRPDLVLYDAGVDPHQDDSLGR